MAKDHNQDESHRPYYRNDPTAGQVTALTVMPARLRVKIEIQIGLLRAGRVETEPILGIFALGATCFAQKRPNYRHKTVL